MDFGNSLHSPDVCVCCLRFFCSSEKTSPCPRAPLPTPCPGRFRFYLSKVFHSVVIVWVASSIVAKANIYLGFSLLSICSRLALNLYVCMPVCIGVCTASPSSLLAALCYKLNLRGLKSNVVVRNDLSPRLTLSKNWSSASLWGHNRSVIVPTAGYIVYYNTIILLNSDTRSNLNVSVWGCVPALYEIYNYQ